VPESDLRPALRGDGHEATLPRRGSPFPFRRSCDT
jgi:hypothetical protein